MSTTNEIFTSDQQQQLSPQEQQQLNMSTLSESDELAADNDNNKYSPRIPTSVKKMSLGLGSFKRGTFTAGDAEIVTPALTPVKEHQERLERERADVLNTSGTEKLQLMRQQLEENKARFAQRSTNNQQLMQIVSKIREKMDETQQSLIETGELRRSMTDLSTAYNDTTDPRERHRSVTDLSGRGLLNIDRERNKYLENRVRLLEKQLNKERNSVTQAREHIKKLEAENVKIERSQKVLAHVHGKQVPGEGDGSNDVVKANAVEDTSTEIVEDKSTDMQVKLEMAKQIQDLQNEVIKFQDKCKELEDETAAMRAQLKSKHTLSDGSDALATLEATVEKMREQLSTCQETIKKQEDDIAEKVTELNILNANVLVLEEKLANSIKNKPLFLPTSEDITAVLYADVEQLKQKLDENNKAMIKLKLKCKTYEKQAKSTQSSELQKENGRLMAINEELQQKLTELEDEKGQWQLATVDESTTSEVGKQQTEAIRLLEEQKLELQEELQKMQQEKDSVRVKSELTEAQLEEQSAHRIQQLELAHQEKVQTLEKQLSHYISENMELLDKIEKLSKSSSSAESIEIVERLTQQEHAELDEFNKRLTHAESDGEDVERDTRIATLPSLVSELTQTDITPEVSESLAQLRDESTELKNKIELFTNERREVLEKMELLMDKNVSLTAKVDELSAEKAEYESSAADWANIKSKLEKELAESEKENEQLSLQVSESSVQKTQLSQELTSLQQSSEVVAALDTTEGATLFDKCERSLSKLNSELEAYRKANDKNAKFSVSKKLAKEAKNVHTQLSELLAKVKEASSAVETVTVVETVVAVTAPNGKALAEYEQLTAQNRELKASVVDLQQKLAELRDRYDMTELRATTPQPAIADAASDVAGSQLDNKELEQLQEELRDYETQCTSLQSTVEDLRIQLVEALTAFDEKNEELSKISALLQTFAGEDTNERIEKLVEELDKQKVFVGELQEKELQLREQLIEANTCLSETSQQLDTQRTESNRLAKQLEELERLLNDKEMIYEKQIEHLTRLRCELEAKCETYEGEMAILQTLISEQKQQVIEAYSESEHKLNLRLLELQQCHETIHQLRTELKEYQQRSHVEGEQLAKDLSIECESLRESLKVSKGLAAQQVNELSNKQETIETLNQQIVELYKTIEENTNQAFDKQDEIQECKAQIDAMRRGNEEQKSVVDKLLNELHSHKSTLPQLEAELQRQVTANAELSKQNSIHETRCKEQRDKLKKYAANLKKRVAEHQELEEKLKTAQAEAVSKDNKNADVNTEKRDLHIVTLTAQIENLEKELTEAKLSISKLNEDLKHKIHVNLENRDLIKSLKQQLNELAVTQQEQVVNVLQVAPTHAAKDDVYKQELQQQQLVLNERITEIMRLETQLRCATDEAARKDLQLTELHQQLDAYNARQAQLSSEADLNMRQLSERLQQSENKLNELKAAREYDNQQDVMVGSGVVRTEQTVLQDLRRQLEAKSTKFEKSKEVIKLRNATIQTLQRELKELRHKLETQPEELSVSPSRPSPIKSLDELEEQKQRYDALLQEHTQLNERYANEKANFELTISRLETLHDGIQAKLQEDMSYIESLESENSYLKKRASTLEESVNDIEQQSAGAVERTKDLETQLFSFTTQSERNEEDLLNRIKIITEHDDTLSRNLIATEAERDELQTRLAYLQTDFDQLEIKHQKFIQDNQVERANLAAKSDDETIQLRDQLTAQAAEFQRARAVYDAKLAAKTTEVDELECELSEHLNRVNEEKRAIAEQLERQQDDCGRQMDEIVRLRESLHMLEQAKVELEREISWLRLQQENAQQDQLDLQELRMQAMQDKTEIDNLRNQIETLANNHDQELQSLRQQLADINTLGQNQTDDQVFIETENKRLTDLLQALQGEMQTLRQEVSEHAVPVTETIVAPPPAASLFFDNEQAAPSPFDEIVQPRSIASQLGTAPVLPTTTSTTSAGLPTEQPTIEDLQRNVSDLEKHAQELETKLLARNQLVADYEERLREVQALEQQYRQQAERQLMELQHIIEERDAQLRQLAATQGEAELNEQQRWVTLSARQTQLEGELRTRNQEIAQLQAAMQERERLDAINKQIQVPIATQEAHAPTLDMFFGCSTTAAESVTDMAVPSIASYELGLPQAEPVVEELIQPEKAYICHPKAETILETANDWGVDDDPWASAAESTNLTSLSIQGQATQQPQSHLEIQLHQQSEQIRELEMKLESAEQQKQELHLKAAKLVKKVKELKNQLQQQPTQSLSNDLDIAICDELKSQIDILEAQLTEAKKLNETEQLEKEKLKKRIDVLTAGNERMSEMKEKQDRDVQMYQTRIRELQDRLSSLDNWGAEAEAEGGEQPEGLLKTAVSVMQKDGPRQSLPPDEDESTKIYEAKMAELQSEVQDLNLECQELQASVQEEKSNALRAQEALMTLQEQLRVAKHERDESTAEQEKQRLELSNVAQVETELRVHYNQLLQEHDLLKAQTNLAELIELRARQQEFLMCREQLKALQMEAAMATTNVSASPSDAKIEEYVVQLQEKDSEILHLKQRIEDLMREDQTEKLVLEILTKNQDIHQLKQQVKQLEEDKIELASLAAAAAAPTQELIDVESANRELQQRVEQLHAQHKLLEQEKLHMEEELRVLNDHVLSTLDMEEKIKASVLELDTKNIEISELRKSLEVLQSSHQTTPSSTTQTQDKPAMSDQQWEQLIEQKCTEIAQQWQEYLTQREAEFKSVESVLHARIEQLTIKIAELSDAAPSVALQAAPEAAAAKSAVAAAAKSPAATTAVGDVPTTGSIGVDALSNEQLIGDMKKVLEEQEIEIVTLKEQLAIRSAEYGRLAAQYDPFKLQQQQQQQQSSGVSANEDLQKKLDRALYMLHETDMRCEEITVELGQLLNERDTLQLKLSDSLRQIEIMKAQTNYIDAIGLATTSTTTPTAFADSPYKLTTATTTTTSAGMPSPSMSGIAGSGASINLNQKLSELQTVNHSKDKVIVDEREQRTREMGQLQKDVANLPPANISMPQAAALDLSAPSTRSPSTVLLNWLMGNNKPGMGSQDSPASYN